MSGTRLGAFAVAAIVAACGYPEPAPLGGGDAPQGDDGASCQAACVDFTTVHACPSNANTTCTGATPVCKAGACTALIDVSFGDPVLVATTDSVSSFGLVDINADHKVDLVAALNPVSATSFSFGNGDRTFTAPLEFALKRPFFYGDLDGDGKADLLVQMTAPSLDTYLGDGTGVWTIKQTGFSTIANATTTGRLIDLDEDGKLDFAAVSSTSVVIFYGKGDGTFEPLNELTTVTAAAQVVVADIDGDHHPDLVVRENAGSIETFRRTGARTYAAGVVDSGVAATDLMSIGDFDGDGNADIVTTTTAKDKLVVAKSMGDGTFGSPVLTAATSSIRALVVGDFNGDGIPDVSIVQPFDTTDQTILAFVGRGDRSFKIVTTNVRDTGIRNAIQAVDIVGQGKTDIFYTSSSNGAIRMVPSL